MSHRVLVVSHGHPDFSFGGAELAAYNLFKAFKKDEDVEDAWFLAVSNDSNTAAGKLSIRRDSEYLWNQSLKSHFYIRSHYNFANLENFKELIESIKPTVINFHHYTNIGVEIFKIIKDINPQIKIILTLHEYMAICNRDGQMVKFNSNRLCFNESIEDCSRCMPQFSKEDFWMRKTFIQEHFQYIDHFVSPSEFLKTRYVAWGVDRDKIDVIENGQASSNNPSFRKLKEGEKRNRVAFFGQVTPYKGIDVLLDALNVMGEKKRQAILVEIHGANLEIQSDNFKKKINKLAKKFIKEGCLQWVGSYEPFQIESRMKNIDWVVVPSIWWENSPMVIQEAFTYRRPVIVSDIGGMKEKVIDGVNGMHFQVSNTADLASKLEIASSMDDSEWQGFVSNVMKPITYKECANSYKNAFNT